jgi:hypothetical protein
LNIHHPYGCHLKDRAIIVCYCRSSHLFNKELSPTQIWVQMQGNELIGNLHAR